MSETIDRSSAGGASDPARGSSRPSWVRLAGEFLLLFAIAIALRQFVVNGSTYPNPLWLPVVVLSLEHGLAAGLTATFLAAAIQYSGGLPPAYLTEDMYAYIGRVAAEPVSWACVALLIGHFRSRQIANYADLQADLAERSEQCTVVADMCDDLRSRAELLERHIAADAHASNVDIAEAIRDLHDSTWDNFAGRLTRFVVLLTGASEFSVLLVREGALSTIFQPDDQHAAVPLTIMSDDALFAAIVNERRTLSAAQAADRGLLGNRGTLAVPLADNNLSTRVIGMFLIGGTAFDDHPDDVDRRIALAASEISRLLGRIALVESWHAAASPGQTNGHAEKSDDAAPADGDAAGSAVNGGGKADRAISLQ